MGGHPFGRAEADGGTAEVGEVDGLGFGDMEEEDEGEESRSECLRRYGRAVGAEEAGGEEVDEKPLATGGGADANKGRYDFPMVG